MTQSKTGETIDRPLPESGLSKSALRGWLIGISVASVIPRLLLSAAQGIEYDGWLHIFYARQTRLADFWSEVSHDAHPPLYYLLLRLAALLGDDRIVYCLISIVSGAVGVYLVGKILSRVATAPAALFGAAAFAMSASAIVLSSEVRSYALALDFLLLSFLGLLGLLQTSPEIRTRDLWLFFGGASLALMSHNYSIFYVVAAVPSIAVLWRLGGTTGRGSFSAALRARGVAVAVGSAALLASLTMAYVLQWRQWRDPLNFLDDYYWHPASQHLRAFLAVGLSREAALFAPLGLSGNAFAVIVAASIIYYAGARLRAWRNGDRPNVSELATLGVFAGVVISMTAAAIFRRYPLGGAMRHQSIVLPFGLVLMALFVDRTTRRFAGHAVVIWSAAFALLGVNAIHESRTFRVQKIDIREKALRALGDRAAAGHDVYADSYSFIPFFAVFSDCDWDRVHDPFAIDGILRYRARCRDRTFIAYRDVARWNVNLVDPSSLARIESLPEASGIRCTICFHIEQVRGNATEIAKSLRGEKGVDVLRFQQPFWMFRFCGP